MPKEEKPKPKKPAAPAANPKAKSAAKVKTKANKPAEPKSKENPKPKVKRTEKGQFLPGNQEGNKFEKGNKAAEIWTEETITPLLTKMWDSLVMGHEEEQGNFVRANDIKTIQEICIMHDVDPDMWAYFKEKFEKVPGVMRIIKKILAVLEARLVYSGTAMDIFVMKNHYGYKDKFESDLTTNGESLNKGFYGLLKEVSQTK